MIDDPRVKNRRESGRLERERGARLGRTDAILNLPPPRGGCQIEHVVRLIRRLFRPQLFVPLEIFEPVWWFVELHSATIVLIF